MWKGMILMGLGLTLVSLVGCETADERTAQAQHTAKLRGTSATRVQQERWAEQEQQRVASAADRQRLQQAVRAVDPHMRWLVAVEPSPLTVDSVRVVVSDLWHRQHYQARLQAAQALWQAWAGVHMTDDPDQVRLELVDRMGNAVGGSRVWGGSLIWVQER